MGTVETLTATPSVALGAAKPDAQLSAELTGQMMPYDWLIDGPRFSDTRSLTVRQGQRSTITFTNNSTMWHPMHLHGHTFQVIKPDGTPVHARTPPSCYPCRELTVDLVAGNSGVWMLHCHNTYHLETG